MTQWSRYVSLTVRGQIVDAPHQPFPRCVQYTKPQTRAVAQRQPILQRALRPLPACDLAHRAAADALDAGEQLRPPGPATAAVVVACASRMSRSGRSDFANTTWFTVRPCPHRAHVIRRNHDGNALKVLIERLGPGWQRPGVVAPPVARGRRHGGRQHYGASAEPS